MRYLPIAGHFDPLSLRRVDTPAVPQLALRGVLINAICHRDYSVYNATIGLAIYDDRQELWNVGELPSELTFEKLRYSHDSYPRNPKIAEVFYKRGWIERWGTGTLRMIQYCQDNKTPEPEFIQYSAGFAVVFPFKEPMHQKSKSERLMEFNLNVRQQRIILALQEGDKSTKELMEHLQEDISERWLRQSLSTLKNLGLIGSKGRTKSTIWFVIENRKNDSELIRN